jgi:hypothetical protein
VRGRFGDAVKQTILDWTFEGDCDLMTDKFLEAQAFAGDMADRRGELITRLR